MTKYTEITTPSGSTIIERIDPDGKVWNIPPDESNSDYQRYLRWLENPDAEQGGTL